MVCRWVDRGLLGLNQRLSGAQKGAGLAHTTEDLWFFDILRSCGRQGCSNVAATAKTLKRSSEHKPVHNGFPRIQHVPKLRRRIGAFL